MYAWYFLKDSFGALYTTNHRHKWANAVVWLDNPALDTPKILAVSTSDRAEGYSITKNASSACDHHGACDPPFVDYINGTSALLAYGGTSMGRFLDMTTARANGELQDLIMWEQMTEEARSALSEADFGKHVKVPFIDANFEGNLEMARPFF